MGDRNPPGRRSMGAGPFVGDGPSELEDWDDALAGLGRQLAPMRLTCARQCLQPTHARETAARTSGEGMAAIGRTTNRALAAVTSAENRAREDPFRRAITSIGPGMAVPVNVEPGQGGDSEGMVLLFRP